MLRTNFGYEFACMRQNDAFSFDIGQNDRNDRDKDLCPRSTRNSRHMMFAELSDTRPTNKSISLCQEQ